jgi:transcriptional regulator with XRE-family HTH domain
VSFRQAAGFSVTCRDMVRNVKNDERTALAGVVGSNCRRLRGDAGVTRNELAKHARAQGLRWTDSKVGDFEAGRTSPTLATVLAISVALSYATRTDVTLAELMADDGFVVINDQLAIKGSKLAGAARGEPWRLDKDDTFASLLVEIDDQLSKGKQRNDVADVLARSGLDEDRLAKRLNITVEELAALSFGLWQRSMSDERDRRAGTDANAQKRGRISRVLQTELERVIADGKDL